MIPVSYTHLDVYKRQPLSVFDPSVYTMVFLDVFLQDWSKQEFYFSWVARFLTSTGDIQLEIWFASSQESTSDGTYALTNGAWNYYYYFYYHHHHYYSCRQQYTCFIIPKRTRILLIELLTKPCKTTITIYADVFTFFITK